MIHSEKAINLIQRFMDHGSNQLFFLDTNMLGRLITGEEDLVDAKELQGDSLARALKNSILGSKTSRTILEDPRVECCPTVYKEFQFRRAEFVRFRNSYLLKEPSELNETVMRYIEELYFEEKEIKDILKEKSFHPANPLEEAILRSYERFAMATSPDLTNLDDEKIIAQAIYKGFLDGKRTCIITRDKRFPSILRATQSLLEGIEDSECRKLSDYMRRQGVSIALTSANTGWTKREYDTRLEAASKTVTK